MSERFRLKRALIRIGIIEHAFDFLGKYANTYRLFLSGDPKLLIINSKILSSGYFLTASFVFSSILVRLIWPDDPLGRLELPSIFDRLSPISGIVAPVFVIYVVAYVAFSSVPLYVVALARGSNFRFTRIISSNLYSIGCMSVLLAIHSCLYFSIIDLFGISFGDVPSIFHGIAVTISLSILAVIAVRTIKFLCISYDMGLGSFLIWNVAFVIAASVLIGTFLGEQQSRRMRPFPISTIWSPSSHMAPTLPKGALAIVNRWVAASKLRRGEIVLFNIPSRNHGVEYIGRVVALGGDTIKIEKGVPVVNGNKLERKAIGQDVDEFERKLDIITERSIDGIGYTTYDGLDDRYDEMSEIIIPDSGLFILGDFRDNSLDSRFSESVGGMGIVDRSQVLGKIYFVLLPKEIGYLYKDDRR